MAGFLTPLQVEFIDGKKWRLTTRLEYRIGAPESNEAVVVPEGYLTDFASVPRGLWNIFPPTGAYGKAAVVHDFLYQQRIVHTNVNNAQYFGKYYVSRSQADKIFLEAMNVLGVRWWPRVPVFLGVRAGGWVSWNKYREDEHATELEW